MKNGKGSTNKDKSNEEQDKHQRKTDIKNINIKDKNVLCEIKSFQKLKIFEKDEELFRNKKQLEYIKVKIIADYDEDISFNIAN